MSTTTFPTRTDAASTATAGKDYLIYANKGVSDQEPDWLLIGGQRSGKLNRKADEVSAAIDRCIVNSEVEYETPFDVNDSFSVVFDAFCSERAK